MDIHQFIKENNVEEIINLYQDNYTVKSIAIKFKVSDFFIRSILKNNGVYLKKNRKLDIKSLIEGKITYENPYYGSINGNIKKYLLENKIAE